jgi:hypothetical protein
MGHPLRASSLPFGTLDGLDDSLGFSQGFALALPDGDMGPLRLLLGSLGKLILCGDALRSRAAITFPNGLDGLSSFHMRTNDYGRAKQESDK